MKGAIFLNGKIKIFSKAIMLNKTIYFASVLLVFGIILVLSNNVFMAAKYLLDYVSDLSVFKPEMRIISLAAVYAVCALLSLMLVSPLRLSAEVWFYESAKKTKSKISKIFFSYKPHWFFKSVGLTFTLGLFKFLWAMLFLFPCGAMSGYLFYSLKNGISKTMLILVASGIAVSLAVGLYLTFVTFQRYALSHVLFYENDGISPYEALKFSARLMDESCFRLASLKLSFLPWLILCVLVFPAFYVYPYYKISVSYFLNNILSGS